MYYYVYDVCVHMHTVISFHFHMDPRRPDLSGLHIKYYIYRAIVLALQREF